MPVRTKDNVVVSIVTSLALAVVLVSVGIVVPFDDPDVDHAVDHLALAIPVLLLLLGVLLTWPAFGVGPAARLVRRLLEVSLALVGGGLLLEAAGASRHREAGGLANGAEPSALHEAGFAVWSSGLVLTVTAVVLTVVVLAAERLGAGESRVLTRAVALSFGAVALWELGAVILGRQP